MSKQRVLVMSRAIQAIAHIPEDRYDVVALDEQGDPDAYLRDNGAGIRALVASGIERLDAGRMDLLPDLRLIAVVAAGMSGIDLPAARARRIAVTNAGDLNAGDVADFAVALYLAHRRDVLAADRHVRAGLWPDRRMPPGRSVSAERIGIVGLGHIGAAIARRLEPFGCALGWWGPNPKPDMPWQRMRSPVALAEWATVLIVAVAGNDDTIGLVGADVIDALGPDGLIVNVSRGFVIDESAMTAALRTGRLRGAALDVVAHEPDDGAGWADLPNVLLAPHVAGATQEAFDRVMEGARDNLHRLFAGAPLLRRVV